MEAFLSFILIAVIVIYLVGWLGRIALRYWIKKKQKEFAERFAQGGQHTYNRGTQAKSRKEGEVTVEQTGRVEKKVSRNVGDYVDYEEVD